MIIGIGNDIIEIERIKKAVERKGFVQRYFTEKEIALFEERKMNLATISGNFSVKESVSKALGTGVRDFSLTEIEVLRNRLGKPYVILHGAAKDISDTLGINTWHVAISHNKDNVTAMAIGEKR